MSALEWVAPVVVGGGLGAVAIGVGIRSIAHDSSTAALQAIVGDGLDSRDAEMSLPLIQRLLRPAGQQFGKVGRMITPGANVGRLRRNIALAGLGDLGIEGILALKAVGTVALLVGLPLFLSVVGISTGGVILQGLFGAVLGFEIPDIIVASKAERRMEGIRRSLPETLDLLAIAVGAGMGLEAAIDLVIQRLPGPLGDEFHRLLQELSLGVSRREAFNALRERTEVDELSTFALILTQADALGTPLSQVLRAQAAEMRALRRQRAREQGAKTPVKLLFPLLLGIFPALMLIVLGPAVLSIIHAFSGTGGKI